MGWLREGDFSCLRGPESGGSARTRERRSLTGRTVLIRVETRKELEKAVIIPLFE